MEKIMMDFEVRRLDLTNFREGDNKTLSELKDVINEAEDMGANNIFIDLSADDSWIETADLVFVVNRIETDEEFELRKENTDRARKNNEAWKQRQEAEEKAEYLRLKAKFENGN